jgi:hypothetical protein
LQTALACPNIHAQYVQHVFFDILRAKGTEEVVNLFGEYFQGVCVRDNSLEKVVLNDGVDDS